jgi:hypothetical protein
MVWFALVIVVIGLVRGISCPASKNSSPSTSAWMPAGHTIVRATSVKGYELQRIDSSCSLPRRRSAISSALA